MTVKDETGSSGDEHRNRDMWENEETQRDLLTRTLRPSLENPVISFPEEIALHRTDLQLHSDVGGEFQRQITEERVFCGSFNTCPQIPCGLPLNLGGPLWCCVTSEASTDEDTQLCLFLLGPALGAPNLLCYFYFFLALLG